MSPSEPRDLAFLPHDFYRFSGIILGSTVVGTKSFRRYIFARLRDQFMDKKRIGDAQARVSDTCKKDRQNRVNTRNYA